MASEDLIELKFRLADGTDIGPSKYSPATTVASLKGKILAQWPKEKENGPKTINDVKLINAGKILENNRTLAESRVPVGELPGGVITMHVVVRPPLSDKISAPTPSNKVNGASPIMFVVSMCFCWTLLAEMQFRNSQFDFKQMEKQEAWWFLPQTSFTLILWFPSVKPFCSFVACE
ncbi:hypothetical protein FH972_015932 [Carpinus fangiana]|uniref:Ubiquitin-like domain-containing protein n=1 Tax=Carpinus fangiana TaxID=176857 RepID=A0A5N6RHW5_9ROSI|nr:hypothetical protein FH972_015932 [Carpinus fangiana]